MLSKSKVFITRPIPEEGIALLKKRANVTLRRADSVISRRDLLKGVGKVEGLLSILTDKIDGAVMDAAPNLKVIANYAVGFDNIDVEAATQRGIVVTNTPGVMDEAVAEHALALILAVSRRVVEADHFTRAEKYKAWMPMGFIGPSLRGKTMGIIGMGRIGSTLAQMVHDGLGMNIVYTDFQINKQLEKELGAKKVTMNELLKRADVISVHVPLLPSTTHLIDTAEFKKMKKTAILINTSRGPVVSEKALTRALKSKAILGAGIDVFECEPSIDCDPSDQLELKVLDNVVLTPHIASATNEARIAMSTLAATAILDALSNKKPKTIVNPEVWSRRRR
ncbi:MAG: D-glycerate dehydrogenase [Candidatus Kerfeldbacteria bacterium CG15_BIG_FIL_POST_REV_8_21_14_020_45_12]|uniref:D-glycerate dehydrogenase n=1 Tax=Candidatus Kerfeldbacteria bacterium CG15_BIG_FIL_POST_REV_8_21_14_020_45_12 TaxID=2014247 RepID=A0A2M7H477_9BACT|nr:MAG: D-glycerate dehydrogenase [Candidatus Kerfeldbacteria bacterium CG15_BIG_FIL_POST_REV_8_21_14_020_45_12]PJA93565.1 MAG: D-glycerate dehydrogenase [Candidatus Kerfeldbacteria bacterium CG_4_9_14_3_um_filter_45_8]